MPIKVAGITFYKTSEVASMLGRSRDTVLRWLRQHPDYEPDDRDEYGHRLFRISDVNRLKELKARLMERRLNGLVGGVSEKEVSS